MDEVIDHVNYWQVAFNTRDAYVKEQWRKFPLRNLFRLGCSLAARLFVAYFVIPATLIFGIFFLEAYSVGLVETLNTAFASVVPWPISSPDADQFIVIWHAVAFTAFGFSWITHWESPAQKEANRMMDFWHFEHSDKRKLLQYVRSD